jgi:hypothetical protein
MIRLLLAAILILPLAIGCTPAPATDTPSPEQAQGEPAAEEVSLPDLQATYNEAKAAYEEDNANAEGFVSAAMDYGMAVMYAPILPPATKYPLSLAIFKEVLEVDPEEANATDASETIIEIYGSMGRDVPEGSVEDFPLNLPEMASKEG